MSQNLSAALPELKGRSQWVDARARLLRNRAAMASTVTGRTMLRQAPPFQPPTGSVNSRPKSVMPYMPSARVRSGAVTKVGMVMPSMATVISTMPAAKGRDSHR